MPRKRKGGSSTVFQVQDAPTSRPSERPEKETEERRGDATRSEEVKRLQREVEDLNRLLDGQATDVEKLKRQEEKLRGRCRRRDDEIARLEHVIERLRETGERSATRSAKPSGTHVFLSTTDRLSEKEVLNIVRDLNENIYQVAVSLTEEWENLLDPPKATGQMDVGPRVPVLVRLARNRDSMGLTFLLQSCLCSRAADMTLSWYHIYRRLSASSEHRVVGAG
jgi:type I site-specific restriction endonuclease